MSKDNTVFIGENKSFWVRNKRSEGYLLKRRIKQITISVIRALLMFGLCFMIIQPMLTRFAMSLMKEQDLYDSTIVLLPRHVTLENYKIVFDLTDMPTSMINTLWISIVISICQVVAATLVSYGFARFEFPLKKFWFACVVMLIIIPPQTIQAALYVTFSNFDILGIIKATTGSTVNLRSSLLPYVMMSLTSISRVCRKAWKRRHMWTDAEPCIHLPRSCCRTRCRRSPAASCSALYGSGQTCSIPGISFPDSICSLSV